MTNTPLTPDNAAAVVRSYGGIVVQPASKVDKGLVMGVFAPGGVGKTTVAASITHSPNGGPALLLSKQSNSFVVASYGERPAPPEGQTLTDWPAHKRVDVMPLDKFNDNELVRADVLKDPEFKNKYKTVIIDNVSALFHARLRELYGPITDVVWEKHSAVTADVLQMINNWVELAETGPKVNVIFIFQETPEAREIRGQKILSRSELGVNKSLQTQIPGIVNFLGRLYIAEDTKPFRRVLDFTPIETVHQAKFQVDPNDEETKKIPMVIHNPDLGTLLDTVRYHQPWPTERHALPK